MAGFLSVKMKRKDLEEVYDDFSDFSLSSPARKIRRLDAELPPILEEEESGSPRDSDQPVQEEKHLPVLVTEAVPSTPLNDQRALVLYKPVNTPFFQSSSSSNLSITVNSELIPDFKKQLFWSNPPNMLKTSDKSTCAKDCLAVVPWVPGAELSEPMEAEEVDDGKMDVEEDDNMHISEGQAQEGDGLQPWQQQQCMTPQLPQNTSTPIMWSS